MSALFLPVVAVQAMWMRHRKVTIPAAAGPSSGVLHAGAETLRIAVVGDSIAAGYGVESHDQGFSGSLARELSERTGRTVAWSAVGQYGATVRRVRHRLLRRLTGPYDVVLVVAGANDVLGGRQPHEWAEDLTAVVEALSREATRVMVAGIPPFAQLPCMPRILGRHLARRAEALDRASREVCASFPAAAWVDGEVLLPYRSEYFAPDGFHPSALGCRRWSAAVAEDLPTPSIDALAPRSVTATS
ncbi:SGNH/GDSL hydrolase family protein [Actinoplanes sp. HUAS TT8]|uniref:SGNH/GDSL hydrolase family protein n=1 Tax=Actinoplanes sp. HUAS TT8 TaxID=3447453 RepID=UPI003F522DBA